MDYKLLGLGATCYVTTVDHKTVLKGYQVWRDGKLYVSREDCEEALAREAIIYSHLGEHPRVLSCEGLVQHCAAVHSLRLEIAPLGCVRHYITNSDDTIPPIASRLRMALDVAEGLAYIHSRGVQHCDLSCRNLFLFNDLRVKLGDFGASMLEGHSFPPSFCEEPRYELPKRDREFDARPAMKRELFALGSAIYEIVAWRCPFQGLSDEEVESRYACEEFPALEENPAVGSVVRMCWDERMESAGQVVKALEMCGTEQGDQ